MCLTSIDRPALAPCHPISGIPGQPPGPASCALAPDMGSANRPTVIAPDVGRPSERGFRPALPGGRVVRGPALARVAGRELVGCRGRTA